MLKHVVHSYHASSIPNLGQEILIQPPSFADDHNATLDPHTSSLHSGFVPNKPVRPDVARC